MADEQITVEWIATAQQMLTTIQKVDARLDKQEKAMQKLATTSKKGADAAAGSFNALEAVLKKNEAALRDMSVGSADFAKQKAKVDQLREAHKKLRDTISGGGAGGGANAATAAAKGSLEDLATQLKSVQTQLQKTAAGTAEYAKLERATAGIKKRHDELAESIRNIGKTAPVVVKKTEGSFAALSDELREAETELQGLVAGTAAFEKQKTKVDKLRTALDAAAKNMKQLKQETVHAAGSFNKLEKELQENEAALKAMVFGTKAFDDQRQKVDALRASLNAMKGSMTAAASASSTALTAGVGKLQQMAAGMIGLHQVVQAIVFELDKVQQMNIAAAAAQRTVEASIAEMALNVGAENVAPAKAMIAENAPKLGVTQEGLAGMLAGAMSAGAKDLTEAMSLASKTLKLTAGDAAKAGPIMSGMLTLAATTGNRNFDATLGQLSQFQKAGRGEDFAMSINNMSTAIASANAKGERVAALGAERTLEMSAAISQLLQDPTMAVTGTTLRQMVQKMDAFVPKTKATLDDGTTSRLAPAAIAAFNALDTIDKRIEAMRADPELAKQFLSTIEQNQGKVAIREIVTGTDRAKSMIGEAEKIVTDPQQAKAEYDALVAAISNQTLAVRSQNRSRANIQGAATDDENKRGIEGQVTEIVQDTLKSVNMSGLDFLRQKEADVVQAAAAGDTAKTIEAGISTLEALQQQAFLGGIGAGLPVGGKVSEQDKKLMQDQIALLKDIRDELERANAQRPAAPQRPGLPAARPREAPLPGALQP